MGGDGGSIPKRDDLVRTRGKQEQVRFLSTVITETVKTETVKWETGKKGNGKMGNR